MKKKEEKPRTWKDWAQGIIYCLLLIAFLLWIRSWWGFIVVPFVFDAYVTKKINWQWWKELENPVTKTLMSWVDAIVFALVAVYFVNIYFFQNYTIPSSSLEKSLLVGDYLYVSKTAYGPRAPMTPLSMPLCQHTLPFGGQSYITWPQWEYKRISPKPVQLNDIVVFNYPSGDTVAMNMQNADYYILCYGYGRQYYEQNFGHEDLDNMSALERRAYFEKVYSLGSAITKMDPEKLRFLGFKNPEQFGEITWRPVDRRENYVKRCVGLPGQTLEIRDRIVYLDGKPNKEPDNVQYNYHVELLQGSLPEDLIREIGLSFDDYKDLYQTGVCPLTKAMKEALEAHPDWVGKIEIEQKTNTDELYPLNGHKGWTVDNYGPIWIPAKGASITLNLENLPVYERCIRVYEGNDLKVTDQGDILINGEKTTSYTFKMDYYWMQGDNRHNSADSRFWGFVPEDHVVGKPVMIWFSKSPDYGMFDGGIRWERLFRWVDNIK
ncbi:MAG: S26 family signal peptidase [Bacteroidaceae bacterium]|nr:S26 family signal peptidase [Bacteroidaceae bacterium]